jgi:hypothetical protein
MKRKMPEWNVPVDVRDLVEENDGMWSSERWDPILLTVMSDTVYDGREIDLAWQIEFEPDDERLESANDRLQSEGVEADGYGWGDAIANSLSQSNPQLAKRLHLGDCESETCVIWVESEEDCRVLMKAVWSLIFG